jgi:Laminin B (Domain IV)
VRGRRGKPRRLIAALAITMALGVIANAGAAAGDVRSNFGNNGVGTFGGWGVVGDALDLIGHNFGGVDGGYLSVTDSGQGKLIYWLAPPKYRGDFRRFYGGSLSFAARQSSAANPVGFGKGVVLRGKKAVAMADYAGPVGTSWAITSIALRASAWRNPNGTSITKRRFKRILGSLRGLKIQAEFESGPETDDLDSVCLCKP